MTDNQLRGYLDRLSQHLQDGTLEPRDALERAFCLGCETERMAAMHHACEEYSRARSARERAFGESQPPPRR